MQKKTQAALFLTGLLFVISVSLGGFARMLWQRQNIPPVESSQSELASSQPDDSASPAGEFSLSEKEREYLWDLEHRNNLLGKFGFRTVVDAWRNRDPQGLLTVIAEDFEAELLPVEPPDGSESVKIAGPLVRVQRISSDGSARNSGPQPFVDWLLEIRARFSDDPAPQARFDVMRITPPAGTGSHWSAKCQVRFWGTSSEGGPAEVKLIADVTTEAVEEERLQQPGWWQSCQVRQIDRGRAESPLFRETTEEMGFDLTQMHDNWKDTPATINTGGLYSCDFNQDGFSDLLVTDIGAHGNRFYLGTSDGRFEEATRQVGLGDAQNTTVAAFADLDNDGWEDLLLPRTGRIFRNDEGERFLEVTSLSNLGATIAALPAPARYIAGIVPGDFNRDGKVDLYVTRAVPPIRSWLESRQPDLVANQLLENLGDWQFADVTRPTSTGGGGVSCFAAVWSDVNNDRWPDLYIINEFGNGALLVNQNGNTFLERPLILEQNDFGSMGLTCGDINNDGQTDLYVSNMYSKAGSRIMGNMKAEGYPEDVKARLRHMVAGGELYENLGDLRFKAVGKDYQVHDAGWAWGSSLADFDNDGWLDLHVTAGFISRDRQKPDG